MEQFDECFLRCNGDQEQCDFPSVAGDRWMNGNCTGVSSGPQQLYGCEAQKGDDIDIGDATHRELQGTSKYFTNDLLPLVTTSRD